MQDAPHWTHSVFHLVHPVHLVHLRGTLSLSIQEAMVQRRDGRRAGEPAAVAAARNCVKTSS